MRDDVLKYKSCLALVASVTSLQRQVKLANPKDSCKVAVQACGNDDFSFFRAVLGHPPFLYIYRCLFEVLSVILPLTAF